MSKVAKSRSDNNQLDIFRDYPALLERRGVAESNDGESKDSASVQPYMRLFYIHCAKTWMNDLRISRESGLYNNPVYKVVYWIMFGMAQDARRDALSLTLAMQREAA